MKSLALAFVLLGGVSFCNFYSEDMDAYWPEYKSTVDFSEEHAAYLTYRGPHAFLDGLGLKGQWLIFEPLRRGQVYYIEQARKKLPANDAFLIFAENNLSNIYLWDDLDSEGLDENIDQMVLTLEKLAHNRSVSEYYDQIIRPSMAAYIIGAITQHEEAKRFKNHYESIVASAIKIIETAYQKEYLGKDSSERDADIMVLAIRAYLSVAEYYRAGFCSQSSPEQLSYLAKVIFSISSEMDSTDTRNNPFYNVYLKWSKSIKKQHTQNLKNMSTYCN